MDKFLGSGAHSAVFLTSFEERRAAIKLLSVEPLDVDAQLARWLAASKLSHINLLRIYSTGRCELDGVPLLYIVMECADEDLSQVVPERPLTAAEARAMLDPTLTALDYIHRQGFVHAHLKPSNVLALDDKVKLSSDGMWRAGATDSSAAGPYDPPERAKGIVSPPGDVWSLGVTLVEILTQRLAPAPLPNLPEPFATIVPHCLERNPADRWTVPQILNPSGNRSATAAARVSSFPPVGVLVLLAVVVILVTGVVIKYLETGAPAPPAPAQSAKTEQQKTEAPPAPKLESVPGKSKKTSKSEESKKNAEETRKEKEPLVSEPVTDTPATGDQPSPEMTSQARNSIHGRVRVAVKVEVDPAGNVTDAKIDGASSSRYFSGLALNTVRRWKFEPLKVNGSDAGQRWRVRFEFQKSGTKVSRQRLSP